MKNKERQYFKVTFSLQWSSLFPKLRTLKPSRDLFLPIAYLYLFLVTQKLMCNVHNWHGNWSGDVQKENSVGDNSNE